MTDGSHLDGRLVGEAPHAHWMYFSAHLAKCFGSIEDDRVNKRENPHVILHDDSKG